MGVYKALLAPAMGPAVLAGTPVTTGKAIASQARADYAEAGTLGVVNRFNPVAQAAGGVMGVAIVNGTPLTTEQRAEGITGGIVGTASIATGGVAIYSKVATMLGAATAREIFEEGAAKTTVQQDKLAGDAWEADIINNQLPSTQTAIQPQITVKSAGPRVRLDAVGTDSTGAIRLTDGKASPKAPHTPNQTIVYPELEVHGGTVVGKGKGAYPGGTVIPPTKVDLIRKR